MAEVDSMEVGQLNTEVEEGTTLMEASHLNADEQEAVEQVLQTAYIAVDEHGQVVEVKDGFSTKFKKWNEFKTQKT